MADASEPANTIAQDLAPEAAAEAGVSSADEVQVQVKITAPPAFVRTIRELIYWEYAKLMARAAGPKWANNYGFITSRFKKLKSGEIKMTDVEHDDRKQMMREPKCEYCGVKDVPLTEDHIIPLVCGGPDIPSNIVLACKSCNSSKGEHDIFEWFYVIKREKELPKLVWSKYLKLVYNFHLAYRSLDKVDLNHDGTLNILDLGAIFKKYEDKR
jgi:HNH endonuclease